MHLNITVRSHLVWTAYGQPLMKVDRAESLFAPLMRTANTHIKQTTSGELVSETGSGGRVVPSRGVPSRAEPG